MVVVKNTYHNGELGRKISGYSGLVRLITSTKKDMDCDSAENFIKDFIKEVWSVSDGKKIGSNSKRKTNRKSKMMSEKQKKISKCFKYFDNGRIKCTKSVIVNRLPKFVSYDHRTDKIELKDSMEETTRIISPYDADEYPSMPYEFDTIEELEEYFKRAKLETKDTLFYKIQNMVTNFLDQDKSITTQLTTDIQITYVQDQFSTDPLRLCSWK